jgi:alkylation response protein AidB-like acyl-CoA dehydrogenase
MYSLTNEDKSNLKFNSQLSDELGRLMPENIDIIYKNKIHLLMLPEKYGGVGLNFSGMSSVIQNISKYCHYTGFILAMHYYTIGALRNLPEYQLDNYFSQVQKVGHLFASINNPNVQPYFNKKQIKNSIGITYKKRNGCILINGIKRYVSGANYIKYLPIYAFNEDEDTKYPVSVFIVDMHNKGIVISDNWKSNSMTATETYDVLFRDVNIGSQSMLFEEGKGLEESRDFMIWFRLALAAIYLGISDSAYNHLTNMIKQHPNKIGLDKTVREKIGLIKVNLEVANSQLYSTAKLADECSENSTYSQEIYNQTLITKYIVSQTVNSIIEECIKLEGVSSLNKGHLLERLSRDAKAAHYHPPQNFLLLDQLAINELGIIEIKR